MKIVDKTCLLTKLRMYHYMVTTRAKNDLNFFEYVTLKEISNNIDKLRFFVFQWYSNLHSTLRILRFMIVFSYFIYFCLRYNQVATACFEFGHSELGFDCFALIIQRKMYIQRVSMNQLVAKLIKKNDWLYESRKQVRVILSAAFNR